MKFVLVQCVSSKRNKKHPAKELYNSRLWNAQRRYAEAVGDDWGILSAKHGLLNPDEIIEPYDTYIGDVDTTAWAQRVCEELDYTGEIITTAGEKYAEPLRSELDLIEPFAGMRLADRIEAMQLEARKHENETLC